MSSELAVVFTICWHQNQQTHELTDSFLNSCIILFSQFEISLNISDFCAWASECSYRSALYLDVLSMFKFVSLQIYSHSFLSSVYLWSIEDVYCTKDSALAQCSDFLIFTDSAFSCAEHIIRVHCCKDHLWTHFSDFWNNPHISSENIQWCLLVHLFHSDTSLRCRDWISNLSAFWHFSSQCTVSSVLWN